MEPHIKNEAYLVFAEWGPARQTTRDRRLAACFPTISDQERETWIQEFRQVEDEIWKLAAEGNQNDHTRVAFDTHMSGRFPWINEKALDRAWFLTGYYMWHEGYGPQKD